MCFASHGLTGSPCPPASFDTMKTKFNRKGWPSGWVWLFLLCRIGGQAEEAPAAPEKSAVERFLERDYLLGDWGGWRSKLSTNGVDFEFVYFGSVPSNVGGGIKQGSVYEGALLMTLDLDSEKLAGYQGGQ